MRTRARTCLLATVLCIAPAGCGQSDGAPQADRAPLSAPNITLSKEDRKAWPPGPARRAGIPALVYRDVDAKTFARQMALLSHAGYRTVTLETFVRFVQGRHVRLPARPVLLSFDGGRLESWTESDAVLRALHLSAVLFVDVGRVEERDPAYLSWQELNRLQRSGRWDVQLLSGTGNQRIRYGPAPGDVGPFYAYRGADEVLGGWRERVFSDISYGDEQLAAHVKGYRPLAIAPPEGNYGQAGTNDRRIPRLLLRRLLQSFAVVFTQDRGAVAFAGEANPIGRFQITTRTDEAELRGVGLARPRPR